MLHQAGPCKIDLGMMWVLIGKEPPLNTVALPPNVQRGRNAQTQTERSDKVLKIKNTVTLILHCTEQVTN